MTNNHTENNDPDEVLADLEAELARLNPEERQMLREAAKQTAELPAEARANLEAMAQAGVQIANLVAQAQTAAEAGDLAAAIIAQEQAVLLARTFGDSREALLQLSLLLYDLAGYCQQTFRYDEAVFALEEVIILDKRTEHPDLESDLVALEQVQQIRATARGAAQVIAVIEAKMSQVEPGERALLEEASEQYATLGRREQARMEAFADKVVTYNQIQQLADQTRDVAIAALKDKSEVGTLTEHLAQAADHASQGEAPDSPWIEVATFIRAVVACLRGQPLPPVPPAYQSYIEELQNAADSA